MVIHIACGIAFYRVKVTFNLMASNQVVCNAAGYLHPVRLALLMPKFSCQDDGAFTSSKIIFGHQTQQQGCADDYRVS
tara:strand:+ start:149 stop:382 length:234 start_codon:yes stop_codon:yes gene_type:complete